MFDTLLPPGIWGLDLALAAATVFVAALVRGFSGFGSAMINIPILSLLWGPAVGVPVGALIEVAPAIQLTPRALRIADWRAVAPIAAPAVLLLPAGSFLLVSAPAEPMRRAIALLVLVMVALLASGWRYRGPRGVGPSLAVGAVAGAIGGAAGVAGPPVILYLMASGDDPARIRADLIVYFTVLLFGLAGTFAALGLITAEVVWRVALLTVPFVAGTALGALMFPLASTETFRRIALAVLAGSALWGLLG